jgi:hypothetical protein
MMVAVAVRDEPETVDDPLAVAERLEAFAGGAWWGCEPAGAVG